MKRLTLTMGFAISAFFLTAQVDERGVDTTSRAYQIGRSIGEWLPFLFLFTLALLVIIRSYRLGRRDGEN